MNDNDLNNEVMKTVPPIGISTLSILGVPLSDMVYIFTIAYIIINIGCTVYRTYKQTKDA